MAARFWAVPLLTCSRNLALLALAALAILQERHRRRSARALELGKTLLQLADAVPSANCLSLTYTQGRQEYKLPSLDAATMRRALWLNSRAVIGRLRICATHLRRTADWIGLAVDVEYNGRPLEKTNTHDFHMSLFGGSSCRDVELEELAALLKLPQVVAATRHYARQPHVFQTSVLVDVTTELQDSLGVALTRWGLQWYRTTDVGTKFHVAL